MNQHTAIILAGGKSSRMGEDKGLMLFQGKPMFQYVIDAVRPLTERILISANKEAYKRFNYPVIEDGELDKGPLSGIVSALAQSQTEINWILSCDSPFITTKLLKKLLGQLGEFDAVVPMTEGKLQPLIAVYRKSTLNRFEEHLALNRLKMTTVLETLNVNYYSVDEEDLGYFKNINSKADL